MDKEMPDEILDTGVEPTYRITRDREHLVNLRQLGPDPVELVQLPNGWRETKPSVNCTKSCFPLYREPYPNLKSYC